MIGGRATTSGVVAPAAALGYGMYATAEAVDSLIDRFFPSAADRVANNVADGRPGVAIDTSSLLRRFDTPGYELRLDARVAGRQPVISPKAIEEILPTLT